MNASQARAKTKEHVPTVAQELETIYRGISHNCERGFCHYVWLPNGDIPRTNDEVVSILKSEGYEIVKYDAINWCEIRWRVNET